MGYLRRLKGCSKDTLTGSGNSKHSCRTCYSFLFSFTRPGSAVSLSRITPNQYGMCYRKALPQEKERTQQRLGILSETIPVIIPNNDDTFAIQDRGLPEAFLTRDDRLMILRSKGLAVVDTTRFQDLQEHNKQYARLLMFTPWSDEKVFLGQARQSAEACKALYTMHEAAINSVEEQCNRLIRLSVQRE